MEEMDDDSSKETLQSTATRKTLTTFPFCKTTCVCNCGKFNLNDLPHLQKILPEDYEYKLCEYLPLDRDDKFLVTLRMTLATKEEALEWKRRFEERSLTTHVKDKTFPKVERVSDFKAQYRCQFFDRRKNKKKFPEKSKFRDCHSILFINIKKYFKNTVDRHMPTYRAVVRLHYAHDHPLDTADVLKRRQLNEDIKQRFLEMFRQGMKPKDALDRHKSELLLKLGPEKYRQVVCDGYYVPNVPKAYRLYYQVHGKGVSARTTTKRSSRHNPNPDWIAFQGCPDAVAGGDDGGGEDVKDVDVDSGDDNIDDDEDDNDDGDDGNEDAVAANENGSCGVAVSERSNVHLIQQQMNSSLACQELLNHQLPTGHVIHDNRERMTSQNLPDTHSLGPKPVVNNIVTAHNPMAHHDGQLQKLTDTSIAYPNIAAHNSVYTDIRNQNLPPQGMPVPSFSDAHIGMGLFNPPQPTWENFSMAHQQAMVPHIPPQHSVGFQNLGHQNPPASYMILPNTSCQNTQNHYIPPQGMIDLNVSSQNAMARTAGDVHILGPPSASTQYSWTPNRPHPNMTTAQSNPHISGGRQGKVMPTKHATSRAQTMRKSAVKKAVQRKRKTVKEVNMKNVTKRWMEKKTKVEAETQNLASEVLQNILLADEAEKLKVKLLTFLSDLEAKMTSNPKLFVPAIRNFLQAGEAVQNDIMLASLLKDFGKTEESVLKRLEEKKVERRENRSSQTKLSGCVVRIGRAASNQGRHSSSIPSVAVIKRLQAIHKSASSVTRADVNIHHKGTANSVGKKSADQHSGKSTRSSQEFSQTSRSSSKPQIISKISTNTNSIEDTQIFKVRKLINKNSKKKLQKAEKKKKVSRKEKQKRWKHKDSETEMHPADEGNVTEEEDLLQKLGLEAKNKKLVVKLSQVNRLSSAEDNI